MVSLVVRSSRSSLVETGWSTLLWTTCDLIMGCRWMRLRYSVSSPARARLMAGGTMSVRALDLHLEELHLGSHVLPWFRRCVVLIQVHDAGMFACGPSAFAIVV
jgi:hypothetical protein